MRKLGQHFLKNNNVIKKIVHAIDPRPDEFLIEVGPGHGELTFPLLDASAAAGAHALISIEKDLTLTEPLQEKARSFLAEREHTERFSFDIVPGDALAILPEIVKSRIPKNTPYKIAGNIPYYITGYLLRTIGELNPLPERTVLLIQQEVAERICADAPHMNRLAASVQFWATPKIIASVPKRDFSPPPEVDSTVILLETRAGMPCNAEQYYRAVHAIFAQPRKTILNNLYQATKESDSKTIMEEGITRLAINPADRPQDLSIKQICDLAERFF